MDTTIKLWYLILIHYLFSERKNYSGDVVTLHDADSRGLWTTGKQTTLETKTKPQ